MTGVHQAHGACVGECPTPYRHRSSLGSGREIVMRCKKRTCPACGQLWAGDTRIKLLANLIDGHGGQVALLTITAPGREALLHDGDGRVDADVAHAWNKQAPAQWSHMNRWLRYRQVKDGAPAPRLLGYIWAYQERGLLHMHLVLSATTELERIANRIYVGRLKAGAAKEWGFGFVDLVDARAGSKGLASYLAKYVCKEGVHGGPELAETVAHPDVPARPVYMCRDLTAVTRCTMRNLRLRRYYWRAKSMRSAGKAQCWYVEDMWQRGITVRDGKLVKPQSLRGP